VPLAPDPGRRSIGSRSWPLAASSPPPTHRNASQFTVDEIQVIVGRRARLESTAPSRTAEGTAGIKNALRAGISSIEHGDLIDDEGIDLMPSATLPLIPPQHQLLAPWTRGRIARGEVPPWAVQKMGYLFEASSATSATRREGVRVVMGTDASRACSRRPSWPTCRNMASGRSGDPGGHDRGRAAFGLADQVGTLQAGKQADLIASRATRWPNRSFGAIRPGSSLSCRAAGSWRDRRGA